MSGWQGASELQFCLSDIGGHDPRKLRPSSHSDLCDLTLLKPLWQLFTQMEYSLFEDVTQAGILLPLHRALTELFFVTENRAQVRVCASAPSSCPLADADGEAFASASVLADLWAQVLKLAVSLTGTGHILEMAWQSAPLAFSACELRQPTTR
jgi:hypothetical protein